MDPYKILEVPRDASKEDIRKAFIAKSKQAHPDKGGDVEHFKQIAWAYKLLSDPDERAYYDRTGEQQEKDKTSELIALKICGTMMQLMAVPSSDSSWERKDFINDIRKALEGEMKSLENDLKTMHEELIRCKNIKRRLKVKHSFDPIGAQLTSMERQLIDHLKVMSKDKEILKQSIAHLDVYFFKFEAPAPVHSEYMYQYRDDLLQLLQKPVFNPKGVF